MFEKITNILVANNLIDEENKDIYLFGLREGIWLILNLATCIIIGLVMNMTWQVIMFLLSYSPIRIFAGGIHAETHLRCYLYSMLMMIGILIVIKSLPISGMVLSLIVLFTGAAIFCLAPVEDTNKPLDGLEVRIYKKRTRIVLIINILVFTICILTKSTQIAKVISLALLTLSIFLLLGILKNKKYKNRLH